MDHELWDKVYAEFRAALVKSLVHNHLPLTFGESDDDLAMMKRVVLYRAVALMPTNQFALMLLESIGLIDEVSNESLWLAFDDETEIEQCLAAHIARNNAG